MTASTPGTDSAYRLSFEERVVVVRLVPNLAHQPSVALRRECRSALVDLAEGAADGLVIDFSDCQDPIASDWLRLLGEVAQAAFDAAVPFSCRGISPVLQAQSDTLGYRRWFFNQEAKAEG